MSRPLALVAILLVALGLAAALLRPRGEPSVPRAGERPGEAGSAPPSLATPGVPDEDTGGSPRERHVRVSGVISAPDGSPLSGVTVWVFGTDEDSPYFEPKARASASRTPLPLAGPEEARAPPPWRSREAALTREDGSYVVGAPAARHGEVVARRADRFPASAKLAIEGDAVVHLVLERRPRVAVRVVDEDGAPLPDARIETWVRRAYSDDEEAPFGWTVASDDGRERACALEVVRDRRGGPSVVALRVPARADERGLVEAWLPQPGAFRVAAFVPGREALLVDGDLAPGEPDRDLGEVVLRRRPDPGRARLVDADGAPLRDRALALTTADDFQTALPGPERDGSRRTDGDGWFSLEHVAADALCHVWVEDASSIPALTTAPLRDGAVVRTTLRSP